MDIKEYIASGIIDSYVLGAVSEQEAQEVRCLSKIYPELQEELIRAQKTFEDYAQSIAVDPPKEVKDLLMRRIRETPQEAGMEAPAHTETPKEAKVVRMPSIYKWSVAASIIVVVGLGLLYLRSVSSVNELESEVANLQRDSKQKTESLTSEITTLQATLFEVEDREAFINAPNTEKLTLQGTEAQPTSSATVYFDRKTGSAILASNGLPEPGQGKQFQLWAIADGKPIDLGVLDKDSAFTPKIPVNVQGVQAFAITLENEGGSPTPTLEQMYVIGNV